MKIRRLLIIAASVTALSGLCIPSGSAFAQDPFSDGGDEEILRLFDAADKSPSAQSELRHSKMSVAELRQARALYRANQRVARLEYNLWMGHEPLRPKWSAVPMMTSRYAPRRIYVPVYIWNR